jgi:hypothetical protein
VIHGGRRKLAWTAISPLTVITVITGPPGTGKSQTVTAILADAWRRGETALLSSANNTPIDDVINNKAAVVDEALVLRTGNAEKRQQVGSRLRELVSRAPARSVDPAASALTQTTVARHQMTHVLPQRAEVARDVLHTAIHRDDTRARLWGTEQAPPDLMRVLIRSRAARTWWGWLRRRRTHRLLELAGITNPAATAGQVLEWWIPRIPLTRRSDACPPFCRRTRTILLTWQTNQRWQIASIATVRNRVLDGLSTGTESLIKLVDVLTDDLPRREAIEQAMAHVKGWATSALSTRPHGVPRRCFWTNTTAATQRSSSIATSTSTTTSSRSLPRSPAKVIHRAAWNGMRSLVALNLDAPAAR